MRSHPDYETPQAVNEAIQTVIESGKYTILE